MVKLNQVQLHSYSTVDKAFGRFFKKQKMITNIFKVILILSAFITLNAQVNKDYCTHYSASQTAEYRRLLLINFTSLSD